MVEKSTRLKAEEPEPRRVLVVEDDAGLNKLAQKALREAGYDVAGVLRGGDAIERVITDPDLALLLDIELPDMAGIDIISALTERGCPVPFVVMTGHGDEKVAVELMKLGASDYLVKELDIIERLPGAFRHLFRELDSERQLLVAQEALRRSERQLSLIYDSVRDLVFCLAVEPDDCFRFQSINHAFMAAIQLAEDQLVGKRIEQVIAKPTVGTVKHNYKRAIEENRVIRWEETSEYPAGVRVGEVSIAPVLDDHGTCTHLVGSVHDITERKRTEEALAREQRATTLNHRIANVFLASPAKEIYADVLEAILDALDSRYGFFGYIDDAGDMICPLLGREVWDQCQITGESIVFPRADWTGLWGRSLLEKRTLIANQGLQLPEGHVPLENALATPIVHRDTLVGQFTVADKPGGYDEHDRELLESAAAQTAPVLSALLEEDRQRQKHEKLEQQYRQAQKMEAVGQLAGGVAHDFNNMLQVILGNGELALSRAEADGVLRASLEEMLQAADRAATLVGQLLVFSRRQVLEMKDVQLNQVINDLATLIRGVIGKDIALNLRPGQELGVVRADRGQIDQILMNLCVNARDAIGGGGTITIETENVQIDEVFCESHSWATPGRYVLLSVTDTGSGMDAETLASIFEPFFTTKQPGQGTGLGLAVVYGSVQQHKGMIVAHSEVGRGTTFEIYLPLTERSATTVVDKIESPISGGSETILLVEDDETVLRLTKRFLEHAGYTVLLASDGEEALRVFDEHADAIDLAVLDVVMPKLGGRAVFERMREQRPQVRAFFASGYDMDAIHTDFVLDEGLAFIQKPYRRAELLRKVRETLDHG